MLTAFFFIILKLLPRRVTKGRIQHNLENKEKNLLRDLNMNDKMSFVSGCSENEDLENEDQRPKIRKTKTVTKTQNLKTASKSKEITYFVLTGA